MRQGLVPTKQDVSSNYFVSITTSEIVHDKHCNILSNINFGEHITWNFTFFKWSGPKHIKPWTVQRQVHC